MGNFLRLLLIITIFAPITASEEKELWWRLMRRRWAKESTTEVIKLKVCIIVLFYLPLFFILPFIVSYFLMRCLGGRDD